VGIFWFFVQALRERRGFLEVPARASGQKSLKQASGPQAKPGKTARKALNNA
jgi:hypothetical protein